MRQVKSVKYNFIMNLILTSSNFIFPLITFPYVSRVLLASGNGKVNFITSVVNYFMMMAALGIPTYGIRACAKVREDKDKLSKTVQELMIIHTIMTLITLIFYILSIFLVNEFYQEKELMLINSVGLVFNVFGVNWLYQALEEYDYITIRSIIFKIISIILMFLFVHQTGDYVIYGAITVFSTCGSYILNFIRLRKLISFQRYPSYNLRQHIKPILVFFAQSMATTVYCNLDTVMLGFMKGDVEVGYYTVAIKIKTLLTSVVTALGAVLLPRLSYYVGSGQKDKFYQLIKKTINFVVAMSLPLTIYFILMANESILFLSGSGYEPAVAAMQIILPTILLIGLSNVTGIQVLTPLGMERYVLISVIVGAMVDLILNTLFIPGYGSAGAAFGTLMAELAVLIVQIVFIRHMIQEKIFDYHQILRIGLSAILPIFTILLIKSWSLGVFWSLLCSAVLYFGIYFLLSLLLNVHIIKDYTLTILKKLHLIH